MTSLDRENADNQHPGKGKNLRACKCIDARHTSGGIVSKTRRTRKTDHYGGKACKNTINYRIIKIVLGHEIEARCATAAVAPTGKGRGTTITLDDDQLRRY